ncbi:carbon-nitrogen hydrolase family protein [Streptosporangium sp. NPDC051022]|uniref:carbon-nitrogen hydrolase family protein n=1 Tax=Streptosporangium sp. NPDC051022 TaxID=3155752 RepID=UPI0034315250
MRSFVAAAVQVAPDPSPLTTATIAANCSRAAAYAERCADATGAELIVLPESVTTGFSPGVEAEQLWDLVDTADGPMLDPLRRTAAEHGAHIVAGTYERGPERGTVYNSAVLIGPTGDLLGTYRKTHLFPGERRDRGGWVTPGDSVTVLDTPLARIGFTICFDGDYPELSRIQAVRGAEVLVRPSALLRSADIWELTTRARAYDNHVFVIAANATGADPGGTLYFGNSLIVTPVAHVIARGTSHEGWTAARLEPRALVAMSPGSDRPQVFDHLADRNTGLYTRYRDDLTAPARTPFHHPAHAPGHAAARRERSS